MDTICRKLICTLAVAFSIIFGECALNGQNWSTVADSLAAAGKPVPDSLYYGFNALRYSMQHRYRPQHEAIEGRDSIALFGPNKHGFWSLSLGATSSHPVDANQYSYSWGNGVFFMAGHRFHPANGWKIMISANQFRRNSDYRTFMNPSFSVEHNLYIMSYILGFQRNRFFDIYTKEGIGVDAIMPKEDSFGLLDEASSLVTPNLHLGFGMQFRFSDRCSFVIEPLYQFYLTQFSLNERALTRSYKGNIRIMGGVQMDLGYGFKKSNYGHYAAYGTENDYEFFASAAAGVQFQNGQAMMDSANIGSSLRECVSAYAGRWFLPYMAVRGGIFHGRDMWKQVKEPAAKLCTSYEGLRGELMFDPVSLKSLSRREKHFSMPFILGIETGFMSKQDNVSPLQTLYAGFCGGLQLRYDNIGRMSIFLEPHCSVIPYSHNSVVDNTLKQYSSNYFDWVLSLQLGVEIAIF